MENDEIDRTNEENRKSTHSHFRSISIENFKAVISFALESVKSLLVIHGSGMTVTFAYISFNATKNIDKIKIASTSFEFFYFGIAISSLISIFAYVSQNFFGHQTGSYKLINEYPFIEETNKSRIYKIAGIIFQFLAFLCGICSIYFFYRGASTLKDLIIQTNL